MLQRVLLPGSRTRLISKSSTLLKQNMFTSMRYYEACYEEDRKYSFLIFRSHVFSFWSVILLSCYILNQLLWAKNMNVNCQHLLTDMPILWVCNWPHERKFRINIPKNVPPKKCHSGTWRGVNSEKMSAAGQISRNISPSRKYFSSIFS